MRSTFIATLALGAGALAAPNPTCKQDNCLRAVDASAFTTRKTRQDCSSFLLTTVTPATFTVYASATTTTTTTVGTQVTDFSPVTVAVPSTIAVTVTVSSAGPPVKRNYNDLAERANNKLPEPRFPDFTATLEKRQMTQAPSTIPTYASYCNGSPASASSSYASACSCIGVTRSTTTVAAPSTTITRTSTVSAVVISTVTVIAPTTTSITVPTSVTVATTTVLPPAPSCSTFLLQAADNAAYSGQYAQILPAGNSLDDAIVFGPQSAASTFSLTTSGQLQSGNDFADTYTGSTGSFLYFDTAANIATYGFNYVTCSLGGGDAQGARPLQCVSSSGAAILQICGGQPYSGSGVAIGLSIFGSCQGVTLNAVCVG